MFPGCSFPCPCGAVDAGKTGYGYVCFGGFGVSILAWNTLPAGGLGDLSVLEAWWEHAEWVGLERLRCVGSFSLGPDRRLV